MCGHITRTWYDKFTIFVTLVCNFFIVNFGTCYYCSQVFVCLMFSQLFVCPQLGGSHSLSGGSPSQGVGVRGLCPGRSLSNGSLSGGLCPGGLCLMGSLCPGGRSLSGGVCLGASLSSGVSVRETSYVVTSGQCASYWKSIFNVS